MIYHKSEAVEKEKRQQGNTDDTILINIETHLLYNRPPIFIRERLNKELVNKNFSELNISFSVEDRPLGTGGGVYNALEKIGNNPFLLTNADILHQIDLKKLPKEVEAAHLVGINNPDHNPQGDFNVKDNIVKVNEYKNDQTWTGVSIINPTIFKDNQFNKPIFNLWDSVLPNYIKERVITGEVTTAPWIDVGTHERLKLANSVYNDD